MANAPHEPGMTNAPVWEDGRGTGLAPLPGNTAATACVLGLGGSGLACVHELLDLGVDVIGLDAGQVASGAAGRNGGFLLAGAADFHHAAIARHGRERALRIYLLTLQQMDRMQQETPNAVRRPGSLRIAASPDELDDCEAHYDAMRADDLDVERYDGPEGRGLLFPADGVFNPLQRCRALAAAALERGARLYGDTAAVEVRTGEVTTSRGTIECDQVFIATDGGMAALLPRLAGRVRTARLQMLATAPTAEVQLDRPVYWRYGFEYWQQLPDGRIALGGFRDTGGDEEWTQDTHPSAHIQLRLERHLREVVGVAAPVTHRWAASVGFTADGLPILDEVAPGVLAFGGYSGTGNVIGALCGRGAARHVFTGDDELVAPFLSPRRPA
ncbi:MAG TPA: FAD-binding oxidoreductase [Longimicrobiales bacterium]|nr:FAD-binding oxidoreductase [Longimicrobiales bacterium]